jgi:anti-sigma factor RsiW
MLRFYLDHRWTQKHLSLYLDEDLAPKGRERIERHTSRCPECRRLLETLARTVAGLMGLREDGVAEGVADRVIARLRAEQP